MNKKKQLEIAFKRIISESLESVGIDYLAPIVLDKLVQKLLKEVSIRTPIK